MELLLSNGTYKKNLYHGLESVSGSDELAQRITMKLMARRGAFSILPDYGSELYKLSSLKVNARETAAKSYIARALEDENVTIEKVEVTGDDNFVRIDLALKSGDSFLELSLNAV